jgi:hypothetical protein
LPLATGLAPKPQLYSAGDFYYQNSFPDMRVRGPQSEVRSSTDVR